MVSEEWSVNSLIVSNTVLLDRHYLYVRTDCTYPHNVISGLFDDDLEEEKEEKR